MQRHRILLTATLLTALTLTACSGGAATTAAPGTTSAGTSPVTTAAATTTPATLPVTTPVQTTTPATLPPATTSASSGSEVGEAFKQSYLTLDQLDSYRVTTETKSNVFGTEMVSTTVMDSFPKEKLYKITSEMAGMTSVSYMVDDVVYTQLPDGKWSKMTMETTGVPPTEAIEEIPDTEWPMMFSQQKTADGYVIKTIRPLTLEEMMKLGSTPGSPGGSAMPEDIEGTEEIDLTYEMEMKLDQNYRPVTTDMTMKMEIEGMKMDSEIKMVYSDFDAVESFKIPQAALDAPEMTIPQP